MSYCVATNVVRSRNSLLWPVLLLLVLPVATFAQGGVGSTRGLPDSASGVHIIKGLIYLPSGERAGSGILLRLSSNVSGSRTGSSDTDGSFMFNSLPAGDYRITIDAGPEYVPLNQTVVIYGNTGGVAGAGRVGQTVMIDLHLVSKAAAANIEKMFAGVPKEAVDNYRKAMQSAQANNSKKAVELLNLAISKHPKFAVALTELGTQYLKLGEPKKAAETLKLAAELSPADFTTRLNYGIALINDKKLGDAETEFREALKVNAASPVAHMYLGIALLSLSRDAQTKQFDAQKYAEAQKELETAVSSGKEEVAKAHRYLAGIYWGQQDHKRAADELELYLKLNPKAPDAEQTRTAIKELRSKQ